MFSEASECGPSHVEHSLHYSSPGSLQAVTGSSVEVKCKSGYMGGGTAVCDVGTSSFNELSCVPLSFNYTSLVSYYTFDQTLEDQVGSNHGADGAGFDTGVLNGSAALFDSSLQVVNVASDPTLDLVGDLTIAFWAYFSASADGTP